MTEKRTRPAPPASKVSNVRRKQLDELLAVLQRLKKQSGGPLSNRMVELAAKSIRAAVESRPLESDPKAIRDLLSQLDADARAEIDDLLQRANPLRWSWEIWPEEPEVDESDAASVIAGLREAAAKTQEKARQLPSGTAKKPRMRRISDEQNQAARAPSYVPPSRTGKRTVAGHFPEDVARDLKDLAHLRRTTVQALLEEALTDLFEKHDDELTQARALFKTFDRT